MTLNFEHMHLRFTTDELQLSLVMIPKAIRHFELRLAPFRARMLSAGETIHVGWYETQPDRLVSRSAAETSATKCVSC